MSKERRDDPGKSDPSITDKTSQGIVRDNRGQEQPADKDRAQSGKPIGESKEPASSEKKVRRRLEVTTVTANRRIR